MSKQTGKTFVIRTVADFYMVPEGRIDECLRMFCIAIKAMKAAEGIVVDTEREHLNATGFIWIDDGKRDISLDIADAAESNARLAS